MQASSSTLRALIACASLLGVQHAHANLLANGSFESGTFNPPNRATMSLGAGSTAMAGWTVVNDTLSWIGTGNPWGLSASDGARFLDLTDYTTGAPFGGVSQVISTLPGATYLLSFDLGSSTFWGRPDALTASAAGASATFTSPGTGTNNDWQHVSMQFTAVSVSTTVQLLGAKGAQYIGQDNASVEFVSAPAAVPEPASWAMLMAGLVAIGRVAAWRASSSGSMHRPGN